MYVFILKMVRVHINNVKIGEIYEHSINGIEIAKKLSRSIESFSHKDVNFIPLKSECTNYLITAVHNAFARHIPLELSPDVIFNTILQGISEHISKNPEHFRYHFVSHKNKKNIITYNDNLIKGNLNNNWSKSINDIGEQILQNMSGDNAKNVLKTNFSTTSLVEKTAHIAVFMDIVKHYYEYTVCTMCGIPFIDITGEKDDWILLSDQIQKLLLQLKLENWNKELQEIFSHFIKAFDDNNDFSFWNKIYNYYGPKGSGGTASVSGWIAKLFLYIKGEPNPLFPTKDYEIPKCIDEKYKNTPWLDNNFWSSNNTKQNVTKPITSIPLADFCRGIAKTPFIWNYYGKNIKMNLLSGLIGITLTINGSLKPEIGWLIEEDI